MDFNHRHLSPAPGAQWTFVFCKLLILKKWSGRKDLNLRPPGPEPGALARLRYAPTATLILQTKRELQLNTGDCRCGMAIRAREIYTDRTKPPETFIPGGGLWHELLAGELELVAQCELHHAWVSQQPRIVTEIAGVS